MKRIEPAFPDLFPVTHVVRPGYLPVSSVSLDPIRMGIVWEDAPRRILPAETVVPRPPICAMAFARVIRKRLDALERLLERGSSVLLVLDDPSITPDDLGLGEHDGESRVIALVPVLPSPLSHTIQIPQSWSARAWGAVLGLFPFPGAAAELERRIERLHGAGAGFAVAAPLLLTPKDRHRILDGVDGSGDEEQFENCLFHADVSRGLHALERRAGIVIHRLGMDPVIPNAAPAGSHPGAVKTAALLRLWARRLDQSYEESSWGWRLRRAASALAPLSQDPRILSEEDNLRVIPGFDPWVEAFTRALWSGGEPLASAWRRWASLDGEH
ncbi:MAG: hypothetical protein GXP48_10375 [Acidobacteria bacterium]|nr:hypothetical protein [Acidobacteriota bacterium]